MGGVNNIMFGIKDGPQRLEIYSIAWSLGENWDFNLEFLYFKFLWWPMAKTKLYTFICLFMGACVQNGVTSSYMDAVWELLADEELEIWTSLPNSFGKEG